MKDYEYDANVRKTQPKDAKDPREMSSEEFEYRKRLQDAVLHISQLVLGERREEILERALARLKFEEGLRK